MNIYPDFQILQDQKMYEFQTLNFLSLRTLQIKIVNWVDRIWPAIPDPSVSDVILGVLPRGEEAVDPLPVSGQDEETQDADNDQDNGDPDRQQGVVHGRVRAGHELQLG